MDSCRQANFSENDCLQVIRSYVGHKNVEVIDYKTRSSGNNLAILIKFKTQEVASASFFSRKSKSSSKLFSNEKLAYDNIFKEFIKLEVINPEIIPKFYMFVDGALIFEDVSTRGYNLADNLDNLSLNHLKLGLNALAKLHAGSYRYKDLKSRQLGRKYQLDEDFKPLCDDLYYGWFQSHINVLKSLVELSPNDERITTEKFKQELDILVTLHNHTKTKDNILCHGNMWAGSVMYRCENGLPVDCKLIDFRLHRFGQPAEDVLQFIYLSTNTEKRQHHLHELLKYYYKCLKLELGHLNIQDIIPSNNFEVSVSKILPQIKLQTALYLMFRGAHKNFHQRVIASLENRQNGDTEKDRVSQLYQIDLDFRKSMVYALKELKYQILYPRVSIEDCFKIVSKKLNTTDYVLVDYNYAPLKVIGGYLGDHYKLKIELVVNSLETCLQLFAKCSPDSKTRYNLSISSMAFVKEIFILETLYPMLIEHGIEEIINCTVPCHLARVNDLLVFDDLEVDGYSSPSPRRPLTYEELLVVTEKLAIYHASNIILEEKLSQGDNLFRLGDRFQDKLTEIFFDENDTFTSTKCVALGYKTFYHIIDMFPEINTVITVDEFKDKVKKAILDSYRLAKPSKKYRNVICHGDLWASNIMMKYVDGKLEDCLIIDYQILRYCPPSHDLLCLLYLTTSRDVRAQHKSKLIEFYYQKFVGMLKRYGCKVQDIYSYQVFLESCDHMEVQAICQTLNYNEIIMTQSDLMKKYTCDENESNKIFMECRKDLVTDMCNKDPTYKARIVEGLKDLLDICVKNY